MVEETRPRRSRASRAGQRRVGESFYYDDSYEEIPVSEMMQQREMAVSTSRIAIASMVGTLMEWYDFFLYGFVAALVLGPEFFPTISPIAGTLAAFATFAVGFLARPLGGVLFGHFGDRIGRKAMLIATLSIMGFGTFAIGCIPTYDSIGTAAPILLTVCRLLQGLALGGEWGGAVLLTVEYAPSGRRGFFGGIVQTGATLGLALATGVLFLGSYYLPKGLFLTWGWRVPFLLSLPMMISGLYIRMKVTETPAFQRVLAAGKVVRFPIKDVLRDHFKPVLYIAIIYLGSISAPWYVAWLFMTYYATAVLKLDRSMVLMGVVVLNLLITPAVIATGALVDRVGTKMVFGLGTLAIVVIAFPFFAIANLGEIKWVWLAMALMGLPLYCMFAAAPVLFTDTFPAQLRYTGISLGAQIATIISGFVPLVATAAFHRYGTWPISAMLAAIAALSFVCVIGLTVRISGFGFAAEPSQ